jgi:hypothetical protein
MRSLALAVAATAALAVPAAANADTITLTPTPAPPGAAISIAVGTSTQSSSLLAFVYAAPSVYPCAPTPYVEGTAPGGVPLTVGSPVGPGDSTFNVTFFPPSSGTYAVCAYLAGDANGPVAAVDSIVLDLTGGVPPQITPPDLTDQTDDTNVTETPTRTRTPKELAGQLFSRLHHHMFGTNPLPVSVGSAHKVANGDSGGAAVSGDNRKTRLAAFHSDASNLVAGDTNAKTDVYVWHRPRGRAGLVLNHLGGALERASVGTGGREANGDSTNPSLDGSITSAPHCVAFQSTASNLAAGDSNATSDIFVRDLRSNRTYLVSGGVGPAATNPSIDGHCRNVAFTAGGAVWSGSAHGGRAHRVAGGSQPDYSLDGSALVWAHGGSVFIRRAGGTTKVGPGSNPRVSDNESGIWGIVFDTGARLKKSDHDKNVDVYTRVVRARGGPSRTDLISTASGKDAYNGGITAYGANRGIIVFGIEEGAGSGLWYRNNNTGNIDDLAFTTQGRLEGIATSARANFVAFTAKQAISPLNRNAHTTVFFKQLVDGESY